LAQGYGSDLGPESTVFALVRFKQRICPKSQNPASRVRSVHDLWTNQLAVRVAKRYFGFMARSVIRRMVYALVAVQMLLSVPVASVMASGVPAATVASPCADMDNMGMGIGSTLPDRDSEPCCPDQSTGAVSCLVACAGVMAGVPAVGYVLAASASVPAVAPVLSLHVLPADPPLNPPPIA
jgi:hypothetical protein